MKTRFTALLDAYRGRPESQRDQSLWQFAAEKDPHLFSHHPEKDSFREHVWEIGGLYFCKGCVMTFAGAGFGAAFFAGTGWLQVLTDLQVAGIFLLLLLPSVLTPFLSLPRWCRHVSRFLLGGLMISAFFMLFVTGSWLVRILIVSTFFAVKIPMERVRNRQNRRLSQS